jgi:hypothetical protein
VGYAGKFSLRASPTGEIHMTDVRIPADNVLPESSGLKSPLSCLTQAREVCCRTECHTCLPCFALPFPGSQTATAEGIYCIVFMSPMFPCFRLAHGNQGRLEIAQWFNSALMQMDRRSHFLPLCSLVHVREV